MAIEPATRGAPWKGVPWILLGLLCAIAVGLQLYITTQGAGVSPDSTRYLSAAVNFASGRGLLHLGDDGDLIPLRLWPPAYPVLLSIGTSTIGEAWSWGRILNAVLFGANACVLFILLRRGLHGRWLPALIGTAFLIASPDVVEIHAWIWSEPLTILAGSLGFLCLDHFLESRRPWAFVLGALGASVAILTRYAASAYVAAGALALLLFDQGPRGRRLVRILAFLAIALGPVALWGAREGSLGGASLGRGLAVNERGFAQLGTGLAIVSDWFFPGRIVEPQRSLVTSVLLVCWLGLLTWCLLARKKERNRIGTTPRTLLPEMLAFFIVSYSAILITVRVLVAPGVSISPRIFSLGLVALVALTTYSVTFALDRVVAWQATLSPRSLAIGRSLVTIVVGLPLAFLGARNASLTLAFAREAHVEGLGYGSVASRSSPVIHYLQELSPEVTVVSNGPDAVYFLTGHPARMLPPWPGVAPESGPFLPEELAAVTQRVQVGDVLVYFRGLRWRGSMTEREVKRAFALTPLIGDASASAYRVDGILMAALVRKANRSISSSTGAAEIPARWPARIDPLRAPLDMRAIDRRRILA